MDPWTPENRNCFINEAVNASGDRKKGNKGTYYYNVMPKLENGVESEDPRRASVTEVLSNTVYMPGFKSIALGFYGVLCHKLMTHPFIGAAFNKDLIVMVKGSNAHSYLAKLLAIQDETFKNSDTDIVICINPFLPQQAFANLKKQAEIVVKQAMSQYKRTLDHLLFLNRNIDQDMFDPNNIEGFKQTFTSALAKIDVGANAMMCSPFESDEVRNMCSRNSFLITNSKGHENSVVRVEVPHFDMCERIPLRKTPLFCSFNETIDFKRDGQAKVGRFNLYRLKMNVLCQHFDEEGGIIKEERIPADFIDVSVSDSEDIELQYFWTRGRSINVYDADVHMWVTIPDLETAVTELQRILTEYECNDAKRVKREAKLTALLPHVRF